MIKPGEQKYLHDIMSPLAGIEMMLETIVEDLPKTAENESIHERLGAISTGIMRMRELTVARRAEAGKEND